MVPSSSLDHVTYGHCGSGCTERLLPRDGIHVFAVNLHTHLAGRGVRLIHIRNEKELPWVSYDNNYNFNFQQIRILREERTILPGDILINRCVYGHTDRDGIVTVGGFSSRHEMCNGFIWYYNKKPNHGICRSEIRSDIYRSFLGIWSTTSSNSRIENIVTAPSHNAGLAVSEVGTYRIGWTLEKRNQLEKYHRYLPHITQCEPFISEASTSRLPSFRNPNVYEGLRRNKINTQSSSDSGISSVQKEIQNPEYEFVSIYDKNIVPYALPSNCEDKSSTRL